MGASDGAVIGPAESEPWPSELVNRLCSVDLCEVFSAPRVGKGAAKFGMKAGYAMDLTTGWDFNKEADRQRAE